MSSVYNPTTGATSCRSCGQFVQFGYDASKYQPACGDCLEQRTPLKQEIVRLRSARADLLYQYDERGFIHEPQLAQARELLEEAK